MYKELVINGVNIKISDFARIMRLDAKGWRVVTPTQTKDYDRVTIGKQTFMVHRLMAYAWLGVPLKCTNRKMVVDHWDENKRNNNLSNLRYVTQKENMRKHAFYNYITNKNY